MHRRWCTTGEAPQVIHRKWCIACDALQVVHSRWYTAGYASQVMHRNGWQVTIVRFLKHPGRPLVHRTDLFSPIWSSSSSSSSSTNTPASPAKQLIRYCLCAKMCWWPISILDGCKLTPLVQIVQCWKKGSKDLLIVSLFIPEFLFKKGLTLARKSCILFNKILNQLLEMNIRKQEQDKENFIEWSIFFLNKVLEG